MMQAGLPIILFISAIVLLMIVAPCGAENSDGTVAIGSSTILAIAVAFIGAVLFIASRDSIFMQAIGAALVLIGMWGFFLSFFLRA